MMKRMMWCWALALVGLTGCDGKLELAKGGRTDYAVVVDRTARKGPIKPMNATNNGPGVPPVNGDQKCGNFEDYKAARIPFA